MNIHDLADKIRAGERSAIALALNLVDDKRAQPQEQATVLLSELSDKDLSAAHLVGMTGPPGVGKSSLGAALIEVWRRRDKRVAVLAVDPSSPLSGGALLGDRLRMKTSADDEGVFVRSLSNRGEFGGLSSEVWPMCLVMMAAFDIVLIETVGVGQRESDIANSCDTTCFVAQPGSGDSIQFMKAGVMEVPHLLVVNKADMGTIAKRTLSELGNTAQGIHPDGDWQVEVLATSATDATGIDELADSLERHHSHLVSAGVIASRRAGYQAHWLVRRLEEEFGRAGLSRLGGAEVLLREVAAAGRENPLMLYQHYASSLQTPRQT